MEEQSNLWWRPAPYQKTIELADGTVLNGYAAVNTTNNDLWVWLQDEMSFAEAVSIFDDSEKTKAIISNLSEMDHVTYSGYIRLMTIKTDINGKFSILLNK